MTAPAAFDRRAYWNRTLRRTIVLLAIWFIAGPLMGILLAEQLNRFSLGGIPFGFWMAQQGSIFVFVILIFVYAWLSDRADREAGVHETAETTRGATEH
jgi:putative solute:sodium symporter small subunit